MNSKRIALALAAIVPSLALMACGSMKSGSSSSSPAPAAAPAAAAPASAPSNVTKVKGLDGWEGEITGKPAPGSKFTKLQIGMGMKQATDLAGQPTDQGAYVTGKAWIPFYFGSDRHRFEMVYKGMGRLIFAGGSLGDYTGGNLIEIIHNAQEGGYR